MSNGRRLRRREPTPAEQAFRDELRREGCPHCGSRRVLTGFRGGQYDYGLRCEEGCPTLAEPVLAHRIAARAAERAGVTVGERLSYRASDDASGVVGVVVGAA